MYTLKSIIQRGTTLGAAVALVVSAVAPTVQVSADALNPLTERSLTLSSSSPGWSYKDGSDNSTYAPPNSGANGKQTGNYFSFKVSTDTTASGTDAGLKAITFQYCKTPAGDCLAPGNDDWSGVGTGETRNADNVAGQKSDLNVTVNSPTQVLPSNFSTVVDTATGALKAIPGFSSGQAGRESEVTGAASGVSGNFVVYYESAPGVWSISDGWTMSAGNGEIVGGNPASLPGDVEQNLATGKNNQITLKYNGTQEGGGAVPAKGLQLASGTPVKVMFFANANNYITNPGKGEFFVRINTYKDDTSLTQANVVDGGVTVANVMNQSIWIQTKVLETMDFSVGTVNPDTLDNTQLAASENPYTSGGRSGICDSILTRMTSSGPANVLKMGDPTGEYSLRTDTTYSTHSYWRLSSNSSAGATVYYSGNSLTNTSGDRIDPIGPTKASSAPGTEQFGLALANGTRTTPATTGPYNVDYNMENKANFVFESGADLAATGLQGGTPGVSADWTAISNGSKHDNRLLPLEPEANYDQGAGVINPSKTWDDDSNSGTPEVPVYTGASTQFAFDNNSNEVPVAIASEDNQVVDCVTGKMRYIANIASTTPAGIYTTKINYIAAPQY